MCFPYWWCTKLAQLITGTWPSYKKLPTPDLNKKILSFDKISPHDFYFFPFLFNMYLCFVTVGKIRKEFLETSANLLCLKRIYTSQKKIVTHHQRSSRPEKCHFHCSLSHIMLFHSKFAFFIYKLYQYTHPVSAACVLMPWVFNKLTNCKPESVRVQ